MRFSKPGVVFREKGLIPDKGAGLTQYQKSAIRRFVYRVASIGLSGLQ
ncbi:MAG: hypothetical protein HY878_04530 [Deltaproteobacteria bacterium]|nr:hypothetical protein [Deltaproteobacteria bacterium]